MSERKAVERVIERIYRDRVRRTGRLPGAAEMRLLEKKVIDSAEKADRRKKAP